MDEMMLNIFSLSDHIRYVAIYRQGDLLTKQKPGIADSSESESDKYEELLVNPTILKIAQQRGNIDCGGLEYVILRYGHFFQLFFEIPDGHISVCIDKNANPIELFNQIKLIV